MISSLLILILIELYSGARLLLFCQISWIRPKSTYIWKMRCEIVRQLKTRNGSDFCETTLVALSCNACNVKLKNDWCGTSSVGLSRTGFLVATTGSTVFASSKSTSISTCGEKRFKISAIIVRLLHFHFQACSPLQALLALLESAGPACPSCSSFSSSSSPFWDRT